MNVFSLFLPQVQQGFQAIPMGDMPHSIADWDIRADQCYLYRMVIAVNNGVCDEHLASIKPGPVNKARWLTTAGRILRLYITKKNPPLYLCKLAAFVVKVYAPFWFLVKSQPLAIHGSRHVFKYISWIRGLPEDVQEVIRPTIENNAYFFHPENVLLSMITDPNHLTRSEGYEKILDARHDPPSTIRQFIAPKRGIINFNSNSYTSMIDWNKVRITEPPCLQFYIDEQLQEFHYSNDKIIEIPGKI